MGNQEAGHTGSLLGLDFPALYETDPSENTGLGYKGLSRVQDCSTSRDCVVLCVPGHLSPCVQFPCVLGTEQCLFRLWEKRL